MVLPRRARRRVAERDLSMFARADVEVRRLGLNLDQVRRLRLPRRGRHPAAANFRSVAEPRTRSLDLRENKPRSQHQIIPAQPKTARPKELSVI